MPRHSDPHKEHLLFLGIGGIGVSAIAELAHKSGYRISGYDAASSDRVTYLQTLGVPIVVGGMSIPFDSVDKVIYSSAVKSDHPAMQQASRLKIPTMHRSEFLHVLAEGYRLIAVAGTHGKTTTSAIVTYMLEQMGSSPTAALGGVLNHINSNAVLGTSDLFVAEADESDGSFLRYDPWISLVTSVDRDHMDYFGSEEAQLQAFRAFLSNTNPDGSAIVCWDVPEARQLSEGIANRLTYGSVIGSEVRVIALRPGGGRVKFDAVVERDRVSCNLPLIGRHNVLNALAALAVARCLDLDVREACRVLETFPGVQKRMGLMYSDDQIQIISDYAHNPGKVAAAIDAVKENWPDSRTVVLFQPHRYSRVGTTFQEHARAFCAADCVIAMEIYAAGESPLPGISGESLAASIREESAVDCKFCKADAEIIDVVVRELRGQDRPAVLLLLGAGDVHRLAVPIASRVKESIRGAQVKDK